MPRSTLPSTAHLVIEIAQTSHARDLEKARDYAAAGVPECWIVDLPAREVNVHHGPQSGGFEKIVTFADGASITALVPDAPPVDVTALLG